VTVYGFLSQFQRENGHPPTQREIQAATGKCSAAVQKDLAALVLSGLIVYRRNYPRGASVKEDLL